MAVFDPTFWCYADNPAIGLKFATLEPRLSLGSLFSEIETIDQLAWGSCSWERSQPLIVLGALL